MPVAQILRSRSDSRLPVARSSSPRLMLIKLRERCKNMSARLASNCSIAWKTVMLRPPYCFALLATLLLANHSPAQDCGLWDVPGNPGQFFGHGFGAGHHAPIVRTPNRHPHRVPRVIYDRTRGCATAHAGYAHYVGAPTWTTSGCGAGCVGSTHAHPGHFSTPTNWSAAMPTFAAPPRSSVEALTSP